MSVIIETSIGDITVDLYTDERPRCCLNFLKLCKIKYYNFSLFHTIQENLIAQCGDPTATGRGGESIFGHLYGNQARFFDMEVSPRIKHTRKGLVSMVNNGSGMHGSQFVLTLADNLDYLDGKHTVFGEVAEGFEILEKLNKIFCDDEFRPHQDIRIYHTVILDDPFDDPSGLTVPAKSPRPTQEMLDSDRIACDADIHEDEGKTEEELVEMKAEREAKANTQILEMVGDLPDMDIAPPENVLFVCKLNPVTTSEDLEIIFSRFGKIVDCDVIKDQKTGESLQYAFIEFENKGQCENAYFKMDNVLIDDRRIHVDFSQSVSKLRWKGKGRGVDVLPTGDAPAYVIKNQQRQSHGYDLVYEDDITMGNVNSSSTTKKQKGKRSSSQSPSDVKRKKQMKDDRNSNKGDRNKSNHRQDRSEDRRRDIERRDVGQRKRSPENRERRSPHKNERRRERSNSLEGGRRKYDHRERSNSQDRRIQRNRQGSVERRNRKKRSESVDRWERKRSGSFEKKQRRDRSASVEKMTRKQRSASRERDRHRARSQERKNRQNTSSDGDIRTRSRSRSLEKQRSKRRDRSESRERNAKSQHSSKKGKQNLSPVRDKKSKKKRKKKGKKKDASSDEEDSITDDTDSEAEERRKSKKSKHKRKKYLSPLSSDGEEERQKEKKKSKKKKTVQRYDSSDDERYEDRGNNVRHSKHKKSNKHKR